MRRCDETVSPFVVFILILQNLEKSCLVSHPVEARNKAMESDRNSTIRKVIAFRALSFTWVTLFPTLYRGAQAEADKLKSVREVTLEEVQRLKIAEQELDQVLPLPLISWIDIVVIPICSQTTEPFLLFKTMRCAEHKRPQRSLLVQICSACCDVFHFRYAELCAKQKKN